MHLFRKPKLAYSTEVEQRVQMVTAIPLCTYQGCSDPAEGVVDRDHPDWRFCQLHNVMVETIELDRLAAPVDEGQDHGQTGTP